MVLPSSPNSISFTQIRNEFYNANASGNPSTYGTTDANLYNVNFYRSKAYRVGGVSGYWAYFSAGALDFNTFRGKSANCACDCDCVCDCSGCP